MDKQDIIRMARKAGLLHESDTAEIISDCGVEVWLSPSEGVNTLERFAALVAAAENEACEKVCQIEAAASVLGHKRKAVWQAQVAERCAIAIRARKQA